MQLNIDYNFDALYSIMQSYHFQLGNKWIPSSLQITYLYYGFEL